jgi:hypothetical protein
MGSAKAAGARAWILPGQLVATLLVLLLVVVPPARGPMLVVALGDGTAATLTAGTRLVAAGPLPGSLIVDGERATLLPHLMRHGAIAIAARAPGCTGAPA